MIDALCINESSRAVNPPLEKRTPAGTAGKPPDTDLSGIPQDFRVFR